FIDPDAYRLRWLLTGSGWSRELYQQWIDALGNADMSVVNSSRDGINTLGALVSAFEDTWNPNVLLWLRASADATFKYYADPLRAGYRFRAVNPDWPEHP